MPEIVEKYCGSRFDHAVASMSGLGLRGARRMIRDGSALLNGRPAASSTKISKNDKLEIRQAEVGSQRADFIAREGDYCFFFKPAGMHTVSLAGRSNASLERQLPEMAEVSNLPQNIQLLQRLDFGTSGVVCGCVNDAAAVKWRNWQEEGVILKEYLALLAGNLKEPVVCRSLIEGNGKKVQALDQEGLPVNWTNFVPLWSGESEDYGPVTLALCQIQSGKRHQIRAHAASLGLPLVGDTLYGGKGEAPYLLSQFRIRYPGHEIFYLDAPIRDRLPDGVWEHIKCM